MVAVLGPVSAPGLEESSSVLVIPTLLQGPSGGSHGSVGMREKARQGCPHSVVSSLPALSCYNVHHIVHTSARSLVELLAFLTRCNLLGPRLV